jgi:flagellar basal body L-ring protein FlgH
MGKKMRTLFLAFLLLLCSCASIFQEPPETAQTITSTLPMPEEPKTTRTLGSLWSGNSSWNHLYSATTSRTEGDLLEIQLTASVKTRIDGLRKKLLKEKYGDENYEPKKREDGLLGEGGAADAPKKMVIEPLPQTMQAVIKDVGQRGLYRISALATVKVGEEEPRLLLEGLVRDRDIDSDDKLSSDAIYGINIELRPHGADAPAAPSADPKVASSTGGSNVAW